jgi:hypothetical protein
MPTSKANHSNNSSGLLNYVATVSRIQVLYLRQEVPEEQSFKET